VRRSLLRLGPTRVHPGVLSELLWVHASRAREVGATLCLLGYEFPGAEAPEKGTTP